MALEDKEREVKVKSETAIPKGTYDVIINKSNRFKRLLPLLLNVPNFDYKKFKNTNKQPLIEKRSGGQLMIDANGKKAYVYPNGAYEEVP